MTEIVIKIPAEINIDEDFFQNNLQVPLIPAERITGVLQPEQIPIGMIPVLGDLEATQQQVGELTARVTALEAELQELTEQTGEALATRAPTQHNHEIINIAGLQAELDAIAELAQVQSSELGRQLLAAPDLAAAKALLQVPSVVDDPGDIGAQPSDADLAAIAVLTTTAFGRGLLALADQATARAYLGVSSSGPIAQNLIYTVSQSSLGSGTTAGTYATLTDGSLTTGAGTGSGLNWIKATFDAPRQIQELRLAGGTLPGYASVAGYLNGSTFEVSANDLDWTPLFTVTGVTDSRESIFLPNTVPIRFARLRLNNYLGVCTLRFLGL